LWRNIPKWKCKCHPLPSANCSFLKHLFLGICWTILKIVSENQSNCLHMVYCIPTSWNVNGEPIKDPAKPGPRKFIIGFFIHGLFHG
jgi:hypothetical protein